MKALELKMCHYFNCDSYIHLGMLRKANVKREKSEYNFGRFEELKAGYRLSFNSKRSKISNFPH